MAITVKSKELDTGGWRFYPWPNSWSLSTSPLSLPPPATPVRLDPSPLSSPHTGHLALSGCRTHPGRALHPWPRLSPPSQLAEIQFCPCYPQLCSSLLIQPQLPHRPSLSFWAGNRVCTHQAHWGSLSPAVVSGQRLWPQRPWHQNRGSTTHTAFVALASQWASQDFNFSCAERKSDICLTGRTSEPAGMCLAQVWLREGKRQTFIQ